MMNIGDRNIDAAEAVAAGLDAGETAICAAYLSRFVSVTQNWSGVVALLTSQRLLIVKDKLFGRPKPNAAFELAEVASTGCGPLHGVGPTWSVDLVTAAQKDPASMYFLDPTEAQEFDRHLRSAVVSAGAA